MVTDSCQRQEHTQLSYTYTLKSVTPARPVKEFPDEADSLRTVSVQAKTLLCRSTLEASLMLQYNEKAVAVADPEGVPWVHGTPLFARIPT